jgi:hypothetical protein
MAGHWNQIMLALSEKLVAEFERGLDERNLQRIVQFAEAVPDAKIVAALVRQLGWIPVTKSIPIRDALQHDF